MFHFNQAVHRKITDLGLASDYIHDTAVRDYCRQLMAPSLLPIEEVGRQFERLQTSIPPQLTGLVSYFKHQWMFGVIPMRMWNFSDLTHRTNNTSEGKQPSSTSILFADVRMCPRNSSVQPSLFDAIVEEAPERLDFH